MFLAVALRVRDPSQPNTVTEIKYSSLNSTAPDHGTTQAPRKHQVTACVTSFGTVHAILLGTPAASMFVTICQSDDEADVWILCLARSPSDGYHQPGPSLAISVDAPKHHDP